MYSLTYAQYIYTLDYMMFTNILPSPMYLNSYSYTSMIWLLLLKPAKGIRLRIWFIFLKIMSQLMTRAWQNSIGLAFWPWALVHFYSQKCSCQLILQKWKLNSFRKFQKQSPYLRTSSLWSVVLALTIDRTETSSRWK